MECGVLYVRLTPIATKLALQKNFAMWQFETHAVQQKMAVIRSSRRRWQASLAAL
jgi:hypothetical protein